ENFFGNFDYRGGNRDQYTLTLNYSPGFTGIANRTGLPSEFARVGQGFGYAGHLSAVDARAMDILSQQADGQDINQRDSNYFGVAQWRHEINSKLTSVFSLGGLNSEQNIRNHNPGVDLNNLTADNSIDFDPTVLPTHSPLQPHA